MLKVDYKILRAKLQKFVGRKDKLKIVFIRNAESSGNLSGTLSGWMNWELTDFGRKQAFGLNDVLVDYEASFDHFHWSDLKRSIDTTYYALAFPSDGKVKQNKLLRECNFGKMEGTHFDSMSTEQKIKISRPDYLFQNGESFNDVKNRGLLFLKQLNLGSHLVFTHGGIICSLLQEYKVDQIPENWSVIGTIANEETKTIEELDFLWEFPSISEDI